MTHITKHAIERAIERGIARTEEQALAVLNSQAVQTALAFGAPFVRLASGHRIVVTDGAIITVLPPETRLGSLDPRRRNSTGARRHHLRGAKEQNSEQY